jgi:hypothetical protein
MTDGLNDKEPTLSGPLKLIAISAAAAILGFGLCAAKMTSNSDLATAGGIAFCISVLVFAGGLLWFLVNLIRRAIRN